MKHRFKSRARSLRAKQTPAEARLWSRLRDRSLRQAKFRRQVPMGDYIVDFISFEARLIIEADGGQHGLQIEYDEARTSWLESQEFQVLRFWNMDILNETDAVMDVIGEAVHWALHPENPARQ